MHRRFKLLAAICFAITAFAAFAENPPVQTPVVRKDRVFLKDVEGIWFPEIHDFLLTTAGRCFHNPVACSKAWAICSRPKSS